MMQTGIKQDNKHNSTIGSKFFSLLFPEQTQSQEEFFDALDEFEGRTLEEKNVLKRNESDISDTTVNKSRNFYWDDLSPEQEQFLQRILTPSMQKCQATGSSSPCVDFLYPPSNIGGNLCVDSEETVNVFQNWHLSAAQRSEVSTTSLLSTTLATPTLSFAGKKSVKRTSTLRKSSISQKIEDGDAAGNQDMRMLCLRFHELEEKLNTPHKVNYGKKGKKSVRALYRPPVGAGSCFPNDWHLVAKPTHVGMPHLGVHLRSFFEEDKRIFERNFAVDDVISEKLLEVKDYAVDGYLSSPEKGRHHHRSPHSAAFHERFYGVKPRFYVDMNLTQEIASLSAKVLRSVFLCQEQTRVLSLEHLEWSLQEAKRMAPYRKYAKSLESLNVHNMKACDLSGYLNDVDAPTESNPEPLWHRGVLVGMREVERAVRLNQIRCVFVAPNIDKCQRKGGLDERVLQLLVSCEEFKIPVVFGLHRLALGKAFGRKGASRVSMSVVGIKKGIKGSEDILEALIKAVDKERNEWRASHPSAISPAGNLKCLQKSSAYKQSIRQMAEARQRYYNLKKQSEKTT